MRHAHVRRVFPTRAFTLVEVLTVIAIIGILMGLLLPMMGGALATARAHQCSERLRQLGTAMINYTSDRDSLPGYLQKFGEFPGGVDPSDPGNFGGAVPRHLKIGGWPIAAMSKLDNQPLYEVWSMDRYPLIAGPGSENEISFDGYSAAASPEFDVFVCPSGSGFLSSRGLNHYVANTGGANVAMADGSVRFLIETIDYRVYQAMMTPKGKSSDVPSNEFLPTESN